MRVLITALDWGLGHTMRIIPLVKKEIANGNEVIFAGSKRQITLLEEWFPEIKHCISASVSPVFSKRNVQFFAWLKFIPSFLLQFIKDRRTIKKICRQLQPDKIISDNRYGMYHSEIESVFITHQLNIQVPGWGKLFEKAINKINARAINKFSTCYVPDISSGKMAGILSQNNKRITIPLKFIGILSRFECIQKKPDLMITDIIFVLSGPENQRTVLENIILNIVADLPESVSYLIVRGIVSKEIQEIPHTINYCSAGDLKHLLENAKAIVCRSGYSTLMDLCYLNKKALLIPTPGQTEQEYLAQHFTENMGFDHADQKNFSYTVLSDYLRKCSLL